MAFVAGSGGGSGAGLGAATESGLPSASQPLVGAMAQAREEAADRGFLWRIQRGGHTSFLYGTLHLGRAEWFSPGPAVRAALDHADVVALEVDMSAPEVQETMQAEVRRSAHQLSPRVE
ncbi:MAG: TraB/GumN family protein [Burkholderiaceae bacterium]